MPDYSQLDTPALLAEAARLEERSPMDRIARMTLLIPALVQRVRELEAAATNVTCVNAWERAETIAKAWGPAYDGLVEDIRDAIIEAASSSASPEFVRALVHRVRELEADKERLANIARGCHDYGGGYREERESEIYHNGIQTVINALEGVMRGDNDLQIRVLEAVGADAARKAAPGEGE